MCCFRGSASLQSNMENVKAFSIPAYAQEMNVYLGISISMNE